MDNADQKAAELLPCTKYCCEPAEDEDDHDKRCPWRYRPAVAAALAERDAEIAELRAERDTYQRIADRNRRRQGGKLIMDNADQKAAELLPFLTDKLIATLRAEVGMVRTPRQEAALNDTKDYLAMADELAKLRAERDEFQRKYHEAMNIMSEWENIDSAAAVAENQELRARGTRLDGLKMALDAVRIARVGFETSTIRALIAAEEKRNG